MPKMPKVDVLLVTYNHARYVAKAVESILRQDYAGFLRVIVADDCSDDETASIVRSISEGQDRVEFAFLNSVRNVGITRNYEKGFSACNADYIAVLEGDDFWSSSKKLSKQIQFLEEHAECVACGCNYHVYEEEQRSYALRIDKAEGLNFATARHLIEDNIIGNFSTCVYRRSVFALLPSDLFLTDVYDWGVNICVAMHGLIGIICEPLSVYRIHPEGAWSGLAKRNKIQAQIDSISDYDRLTGGLFSKEFSQLRQRLTDGLGLPQKSGWRQRLSPWSILNSLCPPLIASLARLVLPPSILHRLRSALS